MHIAGGLVADYISLQDLFVKKDSFQRSLASQLVERNRCSEIVAGACLGEPEICCHCFSPSAIVAE